MCLAGAPPRGDGAAPEGGAARGPPPAARAVAGEPAGSGHGRAAAARRRQPRGARRPGARGPALRLRQQVQWPAQCPRLCRRLGHAGAAGVLLHGAPGTGKTLLARTLAAEAGLRLVDVDLPRLGGAGLARSDQGLAGAFALARLRAPCLLLLGELQVLFGRRAAAAGRMRRGALAQLVAELDSHSRRASTAAPRDRVIVVGSTTSPAELDEALLRAGRLECALRVSAPATAARRRLLARQLLALGASRVGAAELAARTAGFTRSAVASCGQRAALAALRRALSRAQLFEDAVSYRTCRSS